MRLWKTVTKVESQIEHHHLISIVTVALLVVALVAALVLIRQNQDLRQQASTGNDFQVADSFMNRQTPSPLPSGCSYQQVQCVQAPCPPILVCEGGDATPSATSQPPQPTTFPGGGGSPQPSPSPTASPVPTTVPSPFPSYPSRRGDAINWQTNNAVLLARSLTIETNGQVFTGQGSNLRVQSDPGNPNYTTLEVFWDENNVPMRLFIYFYGDQNTWWIKGIRAYNGTNPGNWLYFLPEDGTRFFESPQSQAYQAPIIELNSIDGPSYGEGTLTIYTPYLVPIFGGVFDPDYPLPSPPSQQPQLPAGCRYQPVECVKAPCPPILVCEDSTASASATPVASQIPAVYPVGDLNRDYKVDLLDFSLFIRDFGKTQADPLLPADLNEDGVVNLIDFSIFRAAYGTGV